MGCFCNSLCSFSYIGDSSNLRRKYNPKRPRNIPNKKGILHPHEFSCVSVKEIFKANTKIDAAIYPDNVPISSPQPREFLFLSGDDSAT